MNITTKYQATFSRREIWILLSQLGLASLFIGMFFTITQYAGGDEQTGFLAYKQAVVHHPIWRTAFYIHVFSSVFTLLAGFTQFDATLATRQRRWHRRLGYVYVYLVLLINVPTGFVLAWFANGGLAGQMAFFLLATGWALSTTLAVTTARSGKLNAHRQWMIRSYALTLSALTLRLVKMAMKHQSDWSYNEIYVFDAWFALLFNLAVAELLIRLPVKRNKNA